MKKRGGRVLDCPGTDAEKTGTQGTSSLKSTPGRVSSRTHREAGPGRQRRVEGWSEGTSGPSQTRCMFLDGNPGKTVSRGAVDCSDCLPAPLPAVRRMTRGQNGSRDLQGELSPADELQTSLLGSRTVVLATVLTF